MPKPLSRLTLQGRLKVDILRQGKVVKKGNWQPNLILDAGLDKLSEVSICDLFSVAVKGSDTATSAFLTRECTSDDPANIPAAGSDTTYTFSSTQVTRSAGTRDFTTADVGKLMKLATGEEAVLESYVSVTVMDIRGVGLNDVTAQAVAKVAWIYGVRSTEWTAAAGYTETARMATENGRTSSYSEIAGENGTEDDAETRTHTRTFVFEPEAANVLTGKSCSVTSGATTITRTAGTNFTANDVGSFLEFTDDDEVFEIVGYTDANTVTGYSTSTVDGTAAATHTAIACNLHSYNTYTHIGLSNADAPGILHDNAAANGTVSGTTLTASGSVFTSKDLGRWIVFPSTGEQAKIILITSGTVVELANELTGTYAAVSFDIYENTSLNILVTLIDDAGVAAPIIAVGENPSYSGQQIKLTYVLETSVAPVTDPPDAEIALIADSGNILSSDKTGTSAVENHSSSSILSDGSTDLTCTALEPFDPASCALLSGLSVAELVPVGTGDPPNRLGGGNAPEIETMTALGYSDGEFSQVYQAIFDYTVEYDWKIMGIFDVSANQMCYTWRFEFTQSKPLSTSLTLRFRKSWNRVLTAPTP